MPRSTTKRATFKGGRWRDPSTGTFLSDRAVASRKGLPHRAVVATQAKPQKYVEIKAVARFRIDNRQFEAMKVKTLKLPTKREVAKTRRQLKKDVARQLKRYTKREELRKVASKHTGTETRRVSRGRKKPFKFVEVREMKRRPKLKRYRDSKGRFRKRRPDEEPETEAAYD